MSPDALSITFEDLVANADWQRQVATAASLMMGAAVFLTTGILTLIVDRHVRTFAEEWEFEQSRRVRLRLGNSVYRMTEPLIDELSDCRIVRWFNRERIALSLGRGGAPLPWTPEEFVSMALMETLLVLIAAAFLGSAAAPGAHCLLIGFGLGGIYLHSTIRTLHQKADERVDMIQRRMPFGIDLIALLMRAGAGFRDAVQTVVSEGGDHPFSVEFRRVLEEVNRGRTLRESLTELSERLRCEDIREMVYAIQKSEELGTPLAEIFASLADQMRLRKSQWAEAAAGKAQIKMQGPQFVIMVACMITIIVPFLFDSGMSGLSDLF